MIITPTQWLDLVGDFADGADTLEQAIDAAYDSLFSSYSEFSIETVPEEAAKEFYDWCEDTGIQTDRNEL